MRHKHFLSLLLLVNFNCFAQEFYIKDVTTLKIISFANVMVFNGKEMVQGSYSSEEGKIAINKNRPYDKIIVSCLGYENLEVFKNQISNDTLLLTPTVYPLNEVVIKTNKKEDIISLGYAKSKRKVEYTAIKGMKICTFIHNPLNEKKQIRSFLFKIYNYNNTKLGFKLHLFEKDTISNLPGKELLEQDIIVILEGKSRKLIEHDVNVYNIEFPAEGAFVGIEWFGVLNEENNTFRGVDTQNGYIEINDTSEKFDTFTQDVFSFYPWKNMESFKDKIKDHLIFKNSPTASFGIKIYKD
jgi:hypothetical protein